MSLLTNYSQIGHTTADSDQTRLQKSFLAYLALFMSMGGVLWGSIALFYDLIPQSVIPYGYVVISIVNMLYFGSTKNLPVARGIQVFISLALPFLFQWSLGGFYSSGFIMLWAVLALIASLTFSRAGTAVFWLVMFVALTVVSQVFDKVFVEIKPEILPDLSLGFAVVNICVIVTIVFALMAYFVSELRNSQKVLKEKNDLIEEINTSLMTAQVKAEQKNKELEKTKKELLEITERQTEINRQLMNSSIHQVPNENEPTSLESAVDEGER